MKIWRRFLCGMNLSHRVVEGWTNDIGMSPLIATTVWGCAVRYGDDGKAEANFYKCVDCGAVIAPFERSQRRYPIVEEKP